MTDREKYLFDVQGYLVVRGFLTPAEVARRVRIELSAYDLGRGRIVYRMRPGDDRPE